jgi:hypothetical protein
VRKIISAEEELKKRNRRNLIIGIILILVMFFSVLGYSVNSGEKNTEATKIIYNDVEFVKDSNLWNTDIGNYRYSFKYNPKETEGINKIVKIDSMLRPLNTYSNQPLYIYSDNAEAATEIYRNLFYQNKIVLRVQDACLEGEKCEDNIPVKNCTSNLIIIRESNNTRMKQQENCVFIESKSENLTELSDSFLFKIIGV